MVDHVDAGTDAEVPPDAQLQHLISGALVTQMLAVAARLGIADLLAEGPAHYRDLAIRLDVSPPALYRALRSLASHGVFAEHDDRPGVFALTPTAELLRSDAPGSQRMWAMLHSSEWLWRSFGHALHSVKSGEPAFEDLYGSGTFQYFAREPEHGELFFATMSQVTEMILPPLLKAYDFSRFAHIMDVGGGLGALLAAVLRQSPGLRGTLFDLPFMASDAEAYLQQQGVSERCTVESGDFFEAVPAGADLHMLKWIIHDWSDEQAVTILSNCRRAIAPGGRLILIEQVVAPGNQPCQGKMLDIIMLLVEGGRERTEMEFSRLFEAAGFRLSRRLPLVGPWNVLEAEPV